jgi:hypothetical protein
MIQGAYLYLSFPLTESVFFLLDLFCECQAELFFLFLEFGVFILLGPKRREM